MMQTACALLALGGAAAEVYFEDTFDNGMSKWVEGFPAGKEMGKWAVSPGKWFVDEEVNKGLQVTEDMRFHSISAKMDKASTSKGKDLVIQFSAKCVPLCAATGPLGAMTFHGVVVGPCSHDSLLSGSHPSLIGISVR
uniref:Calreticulin n=1 Tax=Chrysotila carterae TaxID=13221 RepID=A0A7S4F099_CHRCT|eukprot:211356-Pleurochrysis_carterae.AAC.1